MSGVYEQLINKQPVRVRLMSPEPTQETAVFEVRPLLLIGEFYVNPGSEWESFARVGGIRIKVKGRKEIKHKMDEWEFKDWCSRVEAVNEQ